jgi:very-short-patch-repair endonuclease
MQLAGFRHDVQHVIESFHVDFRLFRHDAAVRIEIEGQCLPRNRFARSKALNLAKLAMTFSRFRNSENVRILMS